MTMPWDANDDPISLDLQAYMVDNDPSQGGSLAHDVVLNRVAGQTTLERLDDAGDVQLGLYRLTVSDPRRLGFSSKMMYEQVGQCLAVAMSMQHNHVLFSPVVVHTVHRVQPAPDTGARADLTRTTRIDGTHFEDTVRGLAGFFHSTSAPAELHREALRCYWDALHVVQHRGRFASFYAALEKAGCDDRVGRKSGKFDAYVAAATGIVDPAGSPPVDAVKQCRQCHNTMKHLDTIDPALVRGLGSKLKYLVDMILFQKCGLPRSGHYAPCAL